MEILLQIKLPYAKQRTNDRESFWSEFRRQAGGSIEDSADTLEGRMRTGILPRLNDVCSYIDGEYYNRPGFQKHRDRRHPRFLLVLKDIEYGSLDLFLKVVGLDDVSALPVIAAMLEVYAPREFRNEMPGNVYVTASASVINSGAPTKKSLIIKSPVKDNFNEQKEIARHLFERLNASFVIPLFLSLYIIYVAFGSIVEEKKEITKEREMLTQERTEIIKNICNYSGPLYAASGTGQLPMTSRIAWRSDFPLSLPVAITEAAAA
jgi:hypothetical protein